MLNVMNHPPLQGRRAGRLSAPRGFCTPTGLWSKNEMMKNAVKELYRISSDVDVRRQYELREKAWRDEQARTAYALQMGRVEGRIEGRAEGLTTRTKRTN
jgi:hypothetical protein